MEKCIVPNCESHHKQGISLFMNPKNPHRRLEWEDAIPFVNIFPKQFSVCVLHFEGKSLIRSQSCRNSEVEGKVVHKETYTETRLVTGAIPTIFKLYKTETNSDYEMENKIDFTGDGGKAGSAQIKETCFATNKFEEKGMNKSVVRSRKKAQPLVKIKRTKCSANGCESNMEKTGTRSTVSFFTFPTDLQSKKLWLKNIGRPNWLPSTTSVVCSLHFNKKGCISLASFNKKLKTRSIPINKKLVGGKIQNEFIGLEKEDLRKKCAKNLDSMETAILKNQRLFVIVEQQKNEILKLQDLIIDKIINTHEHYANPSSIVNKKNEEIANKLRNIIRSRMPSECGCTLKIENDSWKDNDDGHQITEKEIIQKNCNKSLDLEGQSNSREEINPISLTHSNEPNDDHEFKYELLAGHNNQNELKSENENQDNNHNNDIYDRNNKNDFINDSSSSAEEDEILFETTEKARNFHCHKELDNGTVQCTICNKIVHNKSAFSRHIESHQERCTLCPFCGRQFKSNLVINMHIKKCQHRNDSQHREQREERKISGNKTKEVSNCFKCTFESCNKLFYLKYRLIEHIAAHKGIIPYDCGCGRKFKYYCNLYYHIKHSRSKCSIKNCVLPKNVPVFRTYEDFLKYSQCMSKYLCSYCDQKFNAYSKLRDHENTHTLERPYKCGTCGKNYRAPKNLQQHLRISKNCSTEKAIWATYYRPVQKMPPKYKKCEIKRERKGYFCNICNLDFKDHIAIRFHNERLHMEKKITCSACLMKFPTEAVYKRHVKMRHMKYKCNVCKINKITGFNAWRAHNSIYHYKNSKNLFECKKCKKTFENNVDLIGHLKSNNHETNDI